VLVKAYLAGPDVFLPNARVQARRKVAICAQYNVAGCAPLNEDIESLAALPDDEAWKVIFSKDLAMMAACDIIIANLTPFRGPSADAGTLVEVGWFLGRGRPVFGYSNSGASFAQRSRRHSRSPCRAVGRRFWAARQPDDPWCGAGGRRPSHCPATGWPGPAV
jgi:nucleoside 2-deoxyribosyltransferase